MDNESSGMPRETESVLASCTFCGDVFTIDESAEQPASGLVQEEWYCTNCNANLPTRSEITDNVSAAHRLALLGLLLLLPAFLLPIISVGQFGERTETSLIEGVVLLFREGEIFLGLVLGIFSGLFPVIKLIGLIYLTSQRFVRASHPRRIYLAVKHTGRWGMMDVFVTALLVLLDSVTTVVDIEIRLGLYAFAIMVIVNILATARFNTRIFGRRFHD